MRISVYTICYNEEFLLPYFFRHYRRYTDDITVYDNESNDGSIDICHLYGAKVKTYCSEGKIRDDIMLQLKNNMWKESRDSDFVIVTDVDEILYHEDLMGFLNKLKSEGYTCCKPVGYQMISKESINGNTEQLYDSLKHGAFSPFYSKVCLFSAKHIEDINYCPGCHFANPTGNVKMFDGEAKLLHYSRMGLDYFIARMKARKERLSRLNKKKNWGRHFLRSAIHHRREFMQMLKDAKEVV